ncbi:MAG: type I-E CRISPR-associated protein Cas6/Cse3/CasE [Gammaproteobacteria bacterium]|nr:type I-E CRISPR-associated protein Cas6/Cse3/CasE [Gammaproteobacteria bacterium]
MHYFSRIRLRPDLSHHQLAQWALADRYREHQLVWRFFSAEMEKRAFLYHRDQSAETACYYLLSEDRPQDEAGVWQIESRPYKPVLHVGQRLSFRLRVNPVVTRRDEKGRHCRHDVVMNAKHELKRQAVPKDQWPSMAQLCQQEGARWLQRRAEKQGFSCESGEMLVEGYDQQRLDKKRGIRFSTLDLSGVLTVTQVDDFLQTLYQGLGSAKGFGCGLLLVKPL